MPVLPLVASTIVPPGLSSPERSAALTMDTPIRSLTEAAGFWNSSLAAMVAPAPLLRRLIRTSGVLPTIAVTASGMGTGDRLGCVGRQRYDRSNQHFVMHVPRTGYVAPPRPFKARSERRATLVTAASRQATEELPVRKLPSMPALQIIALVVCLAVTAVAVALFAKVVGHFLTVFRLG